MGETDWKLSAIIILQGLLLMDSLTGDPPALIGVLILLGAVGATLGYPLLLFGMFVKKNW